MLNYIIHEDEITVWWDKEIGLDCAPVYTVSVNEDQRFTTKKTYCTVGNLLPDTDYKISLSKNGVFSEALILRTKKKKRRIDVTGAPYLAVGDGVTVLALCLKSLAIRRIVSTYSSTDVNIPSP